MHLFFDRHDYFGGHDFTSRYSRNYAKYAQLAGISYTTYYTDYEGMTSTDRGQQRFFGGWRKMEDRGSIIDGILVLHMIFYIVQMCCCCMWVLRCRSTWDNVELSIQL